MSALDHEDIPMLEVINPATEELVDRLETDSDATIKAKFESARDGQRRWRDTPLSERLAAISRFADLLDARQDALAETLTMEMGKPLAQARGEIGATRGRLEFFLEHTPRALEAQTVLDSGTVERITYEPLGVIANISAWNYPYFVGTNVFVPALLTGNAVLYKPSEFTTLTGLAIADMLWEAGIPSDVFVPLIGGGDVGAALLDQDIDGVFFTGSHRTGVKIAEQVAPRLIKLQLELGGKDPAYVCDDVDVENAAGALAEGAFYNAGQSCCAVERIYVHRSIYDRFVDAFVEAVEGFGVGDPLDASTFIGPLARNEQRDVLEYQVADAVQRGAELRLGGKRVPGAGYFFEPTVLTNVDQTMAVMRDESFGPIIGIGSVGDDAESLSKMQDTDYGLTAAVYTPDQARAEALLAQIEAGSAYWNCCDRVSPRLPWSGRRHSGLGSTLSFEGIRTFLHPKAWHLRAP